MGPASTRSGQPGPRWEQRGSRGSPFSLTRHRRRRESDPRKCQDQQGAISLSCAAHESPGCAAASDSVNPAPAGPVTGDPMRIVVTSSCTSKLVVAMCESGGGRYPWPDPWSTNKSRTCDASHNRFDGTPCVEYFYTASSPLMLRTAMKRVL